MRLLKHASKKFDRLYKSSVKFSALTKTLYFYWVVVVLDWVSSMWAAYLPGVQEQNPFARNQAMRFVLHKGVVVDLIWFSVLSFSGYILYQIIKKYSEVWAEMAVCSLFAYVAWDRLATAVLQNFLIDFKFYVPDPNAFHLILK